MVHGVAATGSWPRCRLSLRPTDEAASVVEKPFRLPDCIRILLM